MDRNNAQQEDRRIATSRILDPRTGQEQQQQREEEKRGGEAGGSPLPLQNIRGRCRHICLSYLMGVWYEYGWYGDGK